MDDKQAVRERVWRLLQDTGAARFPGARGRIPNFKGAEAAAERLAGLPEWEAAEVVKSNPDAPQLPVRRRARREGIVTTVHALQVVDEELPETEHDVQVDLVVTPDEVVRTGSRRRTPGVIWEHLDEEAIAAIPVLAAHRP